MNGSGRVLVHPTCVLPRDSMSTNNSTNGNDCGIDYEQVARADKTSELELVSYELVDEPIEDFLQALRTGEADREAYLTMCNSVVEFLTLAGSDLEDLGGFDREEPKDLAIGRAFDVATAAAAGRHDLAKQYGRDLEDVVERLEVDDDA